MFYLLFVEVDSLSILYTCTYVIRAGRGQCIFVVVEMIRAIFYGYFKTQRKCRGDPRYMFPLGMHAIFSECVVGTKPEQISIWPCLSWFSKMPAWHPYLKSD
jgi:hypothetical protein